MSTVLAPRSTTHSSSSIAFSTIGRRDDRRGEDPVLVVERPLLVDPLVERVDHGVGQLGVVPQALLEQAGQRREHQGPVDAQLVHQLEAGAGLAERGDGPHRLADQLPVRLALGVAVPEVLLLGARPGHDLEGRVRDVLADRALDHDLRAAVDLDVVDGAAVPVGQVPGEGVLGLVEVVVGVEDGEVAAGEPWRRRYGFSNSHVNSARSRTAPVGQPAGALSNIGVI